MDGEIEKVIFLCPPSELLYPMNTKVVPILVFLWIVEMSYLYHQFVFIELLVNCALKFLARYIVAISCLLDFAILHWVWNVCICYDFLIYITQLTNSIIPFLKYKINNYYIFFSMNFFFLKYIQNNFIKNNGTKYSFIQNKVKEKKT